jgi:inorganic pyrophosphatase
MTLITAIIETPKGKGQKFDFDPLLGCFKLNKMMPAGLVFPYDFGYIPGTAGGDGDPLDIMVLSEIETFSGCAVDCRVIGGIKATQREISGERMRNDRIIAVAGVSRQYASVEKLGDLPKGTMDELEAFFANYNTQAGKVFSPLERLSPAKALALIEKARSEATKNTFVQLFLPLTDQNGKPFPASCFTQVNSELKDKFGGFTVYSRSPAEGIWKEDGGDTISDQVLVYEVLTHNADNNYFKELRPRLEKRFEQTEILILLSQVRKV